MDVIEAPGKLTHSRVLVVADWRCDPHAVIAASLAHTRSAVGFAFVVPAWLHGLDWVGDPNAGRPCAARQLTTLTRLAVAAGLEVELAAVGDPDPSSAVADALGEFAATQIVLCRRHVGFRHPLDLGHRLARMTGLPVENRLHSERRALAGKSRAPFGAKGGEDTHPHQEDSHEHRRRRCPATRSHPQLGDLAS